jgi:hypothetical protein
MPHSALREPPCIWTFLSSLGENSFLSILFRRVVERPRAYRARLSRREGSHDRFRPKGGNIRRGEAKLGEQRVGVFSQRRHPTHPRLARR